MKRVALITVLVGLGALSAHGDSIQLTPNVMNAMTPIDSVPTKDELVRIFPQNTATQLAAIAQDTNVDFGVRLRAIRALPQFCLPSCGGTPPHASLHALLASVPPAEQVGTSILLLRATIEAIGIAKHTNDWSTLIPFLGSPSRDIRATTAFALRDLCNQQAVTPLRLRYDAEMKPGGIPQVRLAISAALRDLETCSN